MASGTLSQVLHHLRRLARSPAADEADAELLACFAEDGNEAAFATLVRRQVEIAACATGCRTS